jgi:hypothetical protein
MEICVKFKHSLKTNVMQVQFFHETIRSSSTVLLILIPNTEFDDYHGIQTDFYLNQWSLFIG